MISIVRANLNFEREPLAAPWGFKGGYLSELWQTVVRIDDSSGNTGVGLGTQSVLWCDPRVFGANSESAGNAFMHLTTAFALQLCIGRQFETPIDLIHQLLPEVQAYASRITGYSDLRSTFALNALVAVDHAAWQLYAAQRGSSDLADIVPQAVSSSIASRHIRVACIPAVGYGLALSEISKLASAEYYLFKIKLGSDPDKDGDPEKMLAWDTQRMTSIHATLRNHESANSPIGEPLYYLDANGRYDTRDRLLRLLDHLEKIGALHRTILLEEPFPEHDETDVRDFPVSMVADESAGLPRETMIKLDQGYSAVALKPAAKTLSISLEVAQMCHERGIAAFCADLTVNPLLVDWNKNLAGRLSPIPGLTCGALEANGFQNYRDWEKLCSFHPRPNASWQDPIAGNFELDDEFYKIGGGVFETGDHYRGLV